MLYHLVISCVFVSTVAGQTIFSNSTVVNNTSTNTTGQGAYPQVIVKCRPRILNESFVSGVSSISALAPNGTSTQLYSSSSSSLSTTESRTTDSSMTTSTYAPGFNNNNSSLSNSLGANQTFAPTWSADSWTPIITASSASDSTSSNLFWASPTFASSADRSFSSTADPWRDFTWSPTPTDTLVNPTFSVPSNLNSANETLGNSSFSLPSLYVPGLADASTAERTLTMPNREITLTESFKSTETIVSVSTSSVVSMTTYSSVTTETVPTTTTSQVSILSTVISTAPTVTTTDISKSVSSETRTLTSYLPTTYTSLKTETQSTTKTESATKISVTTFTVSVTSVSISTETKTVTATTTSQHSTTITMSTSSTKTTTATSATTKTETKISVQYFTITEKMTATKTETKTLPAQTSYITVSQSVTLKITPGTLSLPRSLPTTIRPILTTITSNGVRRVTVITPGVSQPAPRPSPILPTSLPVPPTTRRQPRQPRQPRRPRGRGRR